MPERAYSEICTKWKPSQYNWILPISEYGGGGAIFNAFTGACLDFGPGEFELIRNTLNHRTGIDFSQLGDNATSLGGALIAGGFVVEDDVNELLEIERGAANRADGLPLVLTINPTFACNLGCSYCFVGKKQGLMDENTGQQLIDFVAEQLRTSDVPALTVDWFGGEPLLAKRTLGRLSEAFLRLCDEQGIPYSAQVITNATLITDELADLLASWGVDTLQVTLDGSRSTHDARRPWKGRSDKIITRSSYEDTMNGLEAVVGKFAIRLRVNIDEGNIDEAMSLLRTFDRRGWLSPNTRFYPYPAMVTDFTDAATREWSPTHACENDRFDELHRQWLDFLNARGVPVAGESLYGFPEPSSLPCSAVNDRGWVVNFDGELHKCGLDSDMTQRAVGDLATGVREQNESLKYWSSYEPVADPKCRACPALPVCLGGCARDRREDRSKALAENCHYHLQRQPEIVAQHIRLRRENAIRERI